MAEGDREARFEALYEVAFRRVLAYALRRADSPEDAADVVAETFAIAWRRLDDVPTDDRAVLWLYATARRVLANEIRRRRRRSALVERLGAELATAVPPVTAGRDPDRLTEALALRQLKEEDRELLMLAGWEGLDADELSSLLGCSAAAVRIRLHRARRRLAAQMDSAAAAPKYEPLSGH